MARIIVTAHFKHHVQLGSLKPGQVFGFTKYCDAPVTEVYIMRESYRITRLNDGEDFVFRLQRKVKYHDERNRHRHH